MSDDDVAVVGIAVRFPEAADLAAFRANLRAGRDSVRGMPVERVRATLPGTGDDYGPLGYLDDVDRFDHEFFGLSMREAELMDPQHRVALELTHGAFEDSGYAPSRFRGSRTAVVFSAPIPDYARLLPETGTLAATGTMPSGLPSRVAHLFGLTGPCYAIDTGCNGALVAVHQACRELRDGEAEHAVVGGVSIRPVPASPDFSADHREVISASGRCRSFDASADGTAGGEGGAVLLLTTVGRALRDGLPVRAVIKGSAVRHNGYHAATISTPSPTAQAEVITAAWRAARLDVGDAGYLEAHGSGTRLGDAIEVEGLALALNGARGEVRLPIGSVKTNIGHLEHAAGIAGLVKAILSVHHGELYPSLHFERPAAGVDLDGAGLEVLVSGRPWSGGPDRPRRRAGVSSFSLGGVNAHCVVEQALDPAVTRRTRAPALVGVSARTKSALITLCDRLATELRVGTAPFPDVVRTLTEGRDHHDRRVAVVAAGTAGLAAALAGQAAWLRLDGGGPARCGPPPRVVLLLSRDGEPVEPVEPDHRLPLTGPIAETVATQLRAHAYLTGAGVRVAALLSSGVSRRAARLLDGSLSTEEFVGPAGFDEDAGGEENRPVDPGRLRAAADELCAGGPVLFLELGARGEISDLLRTHVNGRAGVAVLSLAPGLPETLGELYRRGVDLDWAAMEAERGGPSAARRIPLPGYPFEGKSCWVRGTGASSGAAPRPPAPEPSRAEDQPVLDWLRDLLGELLHADEVAGDANYFDLGGNSIIAQQLTDRISDRYGVRPKMLDIYEHARLDEFAAWLEQLTGPAPSPAASSPTPEPPALPPIERTDEELLSFGQERMWFHHKLDPGTTLYNLPAADRLLGPFTPGAMRAAWEDLAARHEVLRSNFTEHDGRPHLVINPDLGDFFRFVDLTGLADPLDRVAEATALVEAAHRRGFDLASEPLVRVTVIRLDEEDHVLQYTMHHAVNDGWAPTLMKDELIRFYEARCHGTAHRPPELPVRYRDYAKWQRDLVDGSVLDGELDYWRRTLRGMRPLELRTDRPRPARRDHAGDVVRFSIPPELVRELRALGQQESATLFTVLLAGLNLVLAERSGQDDILVGTPTTGRNRPELWDVIGFFNNTVALRTDLSGEPTFAELIRRVRAVVLGALAHQEIPFDRVVKEVAPLRDLSRNPIVDVLYIHQTLPPTTSFPRTEQVRFDNGGTGFNGLPVGTAKFDLSLVLGEWTGSDEVVALVEFSTQLFDRRTAEAVARRFVEVLWQAVRTGAATPVPDGDLASWRGVLAGVPVLALPTDRPRPVAGSGPAAVHSLPVPPAVVEELRAFARAGAATVPDVLLAGLAVALGHRCGQDEFVIGVAGRDFPLVRVDMTDEPGFSALVRRLQDRPATGDGCPGVPPDELARRLGLPREPGRHPLVDVCFTADGTACHTGGDRHRADQNWLVQEDHDRLAVAVEFDTALFDRGEVAAAAEQLLGLLRAAVREPDTPVQDLRPVRQPGTGAWR